MLACMTIIYIYEKSKYIATRKYLKFMERKELIENLMM